MMNDSKIDIFYKKNPKKKPSEPNFNVWLIGPPSCSIDDVKMTSLILEIMICDTL